MPIWYKYAGYKNNLTTETKEQRLRPVIVANKHAHTADLAHTIVRNNYYSTPDAKKAIEAVFQSLEEMLANGQSITIDGFGTFSLSAQFVKKKVDNNDPEKKAKSESIRAENIEVKNVNFVAGKPMKKRIGTLNFERLPSTFGYRGKTKEVEE